MRRFPLRSKRFSSRTADPFWGISRHSGTSMPASAAQRQRERFPADHVDRVILLGEFCDCEAAVGVKYGDLGPGAAQ